MMLLGLKANVHFNVCDSPKANLIYLAATKNKPDALAELIKQGLKIPDDVLIDAAEQGAGVDVMTILIDDDAIGVNDQKVSEDETISAVVGAIKARNVDCVYGLLVIGADVVTGNETGSVKKFGDLIYIEDATPLTWAMWDYIGMYDQLINDPESDQKEDWGQQMEKLREIMQVLADRQFDKSK